MVIKPKAITELDRLSYVVGRIEEECHVVPEGAFKLTPISEVRPNEAFTGVEKEKVSLDTFVHFRAPALADKKAQLERDDSILRSDWLDPAGADRVKGSWTLRFDTTGAYAVVRNLRWPGYFAHHRPDTADFGSFYLGDGKLNKDLAFML